MRKDIKERLLAKASEVENEYKKGNNHMEKRANYAVGITSKVFLVE